MGSQKVWEDLFEGSGLVFLFILETMGSGWELSIKIQLLLTHSGMELSTTAISYTCYVALGLVTHQGQCSVCICMCVLGTDHSTDTHIPVACFQVNRQTPKTEWALPLDAVP